MKMYFTVLFHLLSWLCLSQSIVINQEDAHGNDHSAVSGAAIMQKMAVLTDLLTHVKNNVERTSVDVEAMKAELDKLVASNTSMEEMTDRMEYIVTTLPAELGTMNAKINAMMDSHAAIASKDDLTNLSSAMEARLNAFMDARETVASKSDVEGLVRDMKAQFEVVMRKVYERFITDVTEREVVAHNLAGQLKQLMSTVASKEDIRRMRATCSVDKEDSITPTSTLAAATESLLLKRGAYWFHPRCDSEARISNGKRTARRNNADGTWKHATVLTNQMLEPDAMFEVRLDEKYKGWAGALYIGVTTHSPSSIVFPDYIMELTSGIWLFNGGSFCTNGDCESYGNESTEDLQVGARVGVMRHTDGSLHLYMNGVDQGVAATDIPAEVYGIIDIYGKTVEVTIVDPSV